MPTQSTEIQATLLSSAAFKRASAVAQNVRYEDGVVCTAPGYQRISLSSELLKGIVAYWPLQEPSGTRFDATPSYNNLTDVPPNFATAMPDVLSTTGIIGAAALFPPMPPWGQSKDSLSLDSRLTGIFMSPLILRVHDLFSSDTTLSSGFINPLIEGCPNDLWTLDTALESGTYSTSIVVEDAPEDSASFDTTLSSGTYAETVVGPEDAPEDSLSFDTSLASGTYLIVVVTEDAPEDSASFDTTLSSGTYAETIVGPEDAPEDSISLDTALASGSYG